ncbi:MAG: 30S ribosomal protein S13 [Candidatus Pacearchaeota archaeon]
MEQENQAQKLKQDEENKKYKERIVRILSEDIEGGMNLFSGLTKIKGISWSFSNVICKSVGIDKSRKIGSLTSEEVEKITEFIKNPKVPMKFLFNRRSDFETGEDGHLAGTDLELKKEFDIKRLKKIKSYRGIRHGAGLTLRGQKTKGNFRKQRKKGMGVKRKGKKQ